MNQYLTIKEKVKSEIVIQKSKFICTLIPVEGEENERKAIAEKLIKEIKKEYFDAKHNCVAYRIIENEKIVEKFSDDGEPNGTAGMPMLNILRGKKLVNVVCIVTRYFGGILLGTGGLVRAYSEALENAIKNSELYEKKIKDVFGVELEYKELEFFKYYCEKQDIDILKIKYLESISVKIAMDSIEKEKFINNIKNKEITTKKVEFLYKKFL